MNRPPSHLDLFQSHRCSPGCPPTSAEPSPAGSGRSAPRPIRPHHPLPGGAPSRPRRHADVLVAASGDHHASAFFSVALNSLTLHIHLLTGRPPTPPTILEKEAWWGGPGSFRVWSRGSL